MRLVIQRVKEASVCVNGKMEAQMGRGLLIFVGVGKHDNEEDAVRLAEKALNLRVFDDEQGKMGVSVKEAQGEILAVSQITLYGDFSKGHRPSFDPAAPPELAKALFEKFVEGLKKSGLNVKTGVFGARMDVQLINEGPVTFIIESSS